MNALRAHDDCFNVKINFIALNEANPAEELPLEVDHIGKKGSHKNGPDIDTENASPTDAINEVEAGTVKNPQPLADNDELTQQLVLFSLEEWQEAICTKLVDKVGTRTYWEDWADDVATIAENQNTRIKALVDGADATLRTEFDSFVEGLRNNLNDGISEDDAISMLSQHLITAPVFNALFENHDFITP